MRRAAAITLRAATFALFLGTVSVTTPVLAVIHDESASISQPSVTNAPTDLPADGTPIGTQPFTDHRNPPPYRKLSDAEFARYDLGMAVFNTHFVPAGTPNAGRRAGVGPLFNSSSCDSCHNNGAHGRGPIEDGPAPSALVIQLATTLTKNPTDPEGDPVYGRVFNTIALDGVPPEGVAMIRYQETPGHYPDGSAWSLRVPHYTFTNLRYGPLSPRTLIKPRLAPALFGAGLLDAAGKDTAAFDRARGRFGSSNGSPEVSADIFSAVVSFQRWLAVPASPTPHPVPDRDAKTFADLGCAACHQPQLAITLPDADGKTASAVIAPYTDLRLHDLGSRLADETVAGKKVSSNWRTAPLWGLGYRMSLERFPTFLHDGRARSAEEAILWHDGAAAGARDRFERLPVSQRKAFLRWIETL